MPWQLMYKTQLQISQLIHTFTMNTRRSILQIPMVNMGWWKAKESHFLKEPLWSWGWTKNPNEGEEKKKPNHVIITLDRLSFFFFLFFFFLFFFHWTAHYTSTFYLLPTTLDHFFETRDPSFVLFQFPTQITHCNSTVEGLSNPAPLLD